MLSRAVSCRSALRFTRVVSRASLRRHPSQSAWWRRHWERTGIVTIELADTMPDGWQAWLDWQRMVAPDNVTEIQAVEADRGRYVGYVRLVARRRPEARLEDPIASITTQYTRKPLLRIT